MDTKVCIKCKIEKPLHEFNKNQNYCRECNKVYYEKNKERIKESSTSVAIRLNPEELMLLDERVEKLKIKKRSEYIKKVVLDNMSNVFITIDFKDLDKVAYEINKIGVNINQIAHIANGEKHIYKSDIQYIKEKQERIEDILCNYYDVVLKLQKKAKKL